MLVVLKTDQFAYLVHPYQIIQIGFPNLIAKWGFLLCK